METVEVFAGLYGALRNGSLLRARCLPVWSVGLGDRRLLATAAFGTQRATALVLTPQARQLRANPPFRLTRIPTGSLYPRPTWLNFDN